MNISWQEPLLPPVPWFLDLVTYFCTNQRLINNNNKNKIFSILFLLLFFFPVSFSFSLYSHLLLILFVFSFTSYTSFVLVFFLFFSSFLLWSGCFFFGVGVFSLSLLSAWFLQNICSALLLSSLLSFLFFLSFLLSSSLVMGESFELVVGLHLLFFILIFVFFFSSSLLLALSLGPNLDSMLVPGFGLLCSVLSLDPDLDVDPGLSAPAPSSCWV